MTPAPQKLAQFGEKYCGGLQEETAWRHFVEQEAAAFLDDKKSQFARELRAFVGSGMTIRGFDRHTEALGPDEGGGLKTYTMNLICENWVLSLSVPSYSILTKGRMDIRERISINPSLSPQKPLCTSARTQYQPS